MGEIIIPQGYVSALNLHDTQVAIKTVKTFSAGADQTAESAPRYRSFVRKSRNRSE